LRVKHERPLVIDIIDSHQVFQQQWLKRKKFYMSNKYTIVHTNSNLYEQNKWIDNETKQKKKKESDLKGKCLIKLNLN